ncbi:hypothetical protein OXB_1949 [Bacillus sp. OxB-1]|uniref:DUF3397 domain-containing protein n=1 Tax=Bacillus sp. (strain OxB-1) TaxID=98228 RepID=UPI0005820170|nr:DUF3397 domain-containing protein [Bacillus sp. OxB-1]BAQ10420.1 hypothetical protein OXB_1949 [Bacillus sp. OxB-1]
MNEVISGLLGAIILFPLIITLSYMVIMRKMGKAPAKMMGRAADVTTPFLFLAVYVVAHSIFGDGPGWFISGIALVIAIVLIIIERLRVKEFKILRVLQRAWRLYFLVLSAAYIILIAVGVIKKIVEYVA